MAANGGGHRAEPIATPNPLRGLGLLSLALLVVQVRGTPLGAL